MKKNIIEIDINVLGTDELEMLSKILWTNNRSIYKCNDDYSNSMKKIQKAISFQEGWMSDKDRKKYYSEVLGVE